MPHYAAPVTAALYVLLIQGIRHWRAMNRWTAGPVMAWGILLICVLMLVARTSAEVRPVSRLVSIRGNAWWCFIPGGIDDRERILQNLQSLPGKHLVLVHYRNRHDVYGEWVYNGSNIDAQKVVWARDMGEAGNWELIQYCHDRQVWVVDADAANPRVALYTARAHAGKSNNPLLK